MPNWMRLTDYGMGMHTGVVEAGTCLSHGCIRMPEYMASRIFDIVEVGFPVTVTHELEAEYPAHDALLAGAPYNTWLYEKQQLEGEMKKITDRAKKRAEAPPAAEEVPGNDTPPATPETEPEEPASEAS